MKKLYTFKVCLAFRRGCWRRIEIRGDQTLGAFDGAIREAFKHDTLDHLSEFFPKGTWRDGFGEIYPSGSGNGARVKVEDLGLREGEEQGYVYDFGNEVRHIITLEKISEPEDGVDYPRLIAKNRPRYRYCGECERAGKRTVATLVCVECPGEHYGHIYLCEGCAERLHGEDDHHLEEVVY